MKCCHQLLTKLLDDHSSGGCIEIVVTQKLNAVGKNYHIYSKDKVCLTATESHFGRLGCDLGGPLVAVVRIQDGRERHDLVVLKDLRRRSYSYPTYNHACIEF